MPEDQAAVTSEFADAVGLGQLKAAGARSTPGRGAPHGSAATPAASSSSPAWPPPPTPEPFKATLRQLDFVVTKMVEMSTRVPIETQEPKYMDEIADSLWPLAHFYGAGAEKPTKAVLWTYAIAALGGYAILVYSQWKARQSGQPNLEVVK